MKQLSGTGFSTKRNLLLLAQDRAPSEGERESIVQYNGFKRMASRRFETRLGDITPVPARLNFAFNETEARSAKSAWGSAAELLLYKSTTKAACSWDSGHRMSCRDGGMPVPDRERARREVIAK